MIVSMATTARRQQRYDHRLRHLVQRTGEVTVATDLGVPRSTARGWLGAAPTVVVGLDGADLIEPELRHEILKLRRRVHKLTALLRLVLALEWVIAARGVVLDDEAAFAGQGFHVQKPEGGMFFPDVPLITGELTRLDGSLKDRTDPGCLNLAA